MTEVRMRKYGCVACGNEIPETEKYCTGCKKVKKEKLTICCSICNSEFIRQNSFQKYCSSKCSNLSGIKLCGICNQQTQRYGHCSNCSKSNKLLNKAGQKYITDYVTKANIENDIHPSKIIRGSHTRGEND